MTDLNKVQTAIAAAIDARVNAHIEAGDVTAEAWAKLRGDAIAAHSFFSGFRIDATATFKDCAVKTARKVIDVALALARKDATLIDKYTVAMLRNSAVLGATLHNKETYDSSCSVPAQGEGMRAMPHKVAIAGLSTAGAQAPTSRHTLALVAGATLQRHSMTLNNEHRVHKALCELLAIEQPAIAA